VKLRLLGTEAECARLAFLPRFGPPELEVLQVDGPYPNRGDHGQVRAYLELRLARQPGPAARTFYSLIHPDDGRPLLVDAWDAPVRHGGAP
jgi:hypothetical protein